VGYTFQFGDVFSYWRLLVQGAFATIGFTVAAILCSLLLGALGATARRSWHWQYRWIGRTYVESIRSTPLLVQLFILYFGLPVLGIRFSPNVAALIGLSIYNGGYVTEILRAGIQAIQRSQIEAGLSIGMSRLQVFLYIVAVPALEKVYQALSSHFVLLMLGTSIISAIGAEDLTALANEIQSANFRSLEVYIVCAIIYAGLALGLRSLFRLLGKQLFSFRRQLAAIPG
jgi:polar amino acid transport system permease protein